MLNEELAKLYFHDLMQFVERKRGLSAVYPSADNLFAAFQLTPYKEVKVVILGQDPFHQPGQADGLCFWVPRDASKLPPSLRNIHAALAYDGYEAPSHGDLTDWARRGVLMLNTALTVEESKANSHAKQWRQFTDAVIKKLSERPRPIVFVLWGRAARAKCELINEDVHEVVAAPHPAARGTHQKAFRESRTFTEVNRRLKCLDEVPVDWSLT